MEWLFMTMDAEPLWGHVWTPTGNDVFWYQETIAPSTRALEIENFQFQRTTKDLAIFLEKATFQTNSNDHSSMMNLYGEHESH
jgi:hypothetical protein